MCGAISPVLYGNFRILLSASSAHNELDAESGIRCFEVVDKRRNLKRSEVEGWRVTTVAIDDAASMLSIKWMHPSFLKHLAKIVWD